MRSHPAISLVSVLLFPALFGAFAAAEVYHLDLETAKRLALGNNPNIIRSLMDFQAAEALFSGSKAELYPSLRLDMTAPSYNESLSEQYVYDPSTGYYNWRWLPTGDYRYQGSLRLEQKLPTGGAIDVSSLLYKRDYFIGSSQDSIQTEYSSIIRFAVRQPLLQPNSVRLNYLRSLNSLKKAGLDRQIALRDLDYLIAIAYYGLVRADRRLQLELEDYQRWEKSVSTAEDKYKAGLIPEVEVLKLKVELARREGTLASMRDSYQSSADELKLALGLEITDSIAISPEVEKLVVEKGDPDRAAQYRQELKKTAIDLKNAQLTYKQKKSEAGLNASLQAYYDFDSKEANLEHLTDDYEQDRGLSLTVTLPLLDWGAVRQKVESSRINLRRSDYDLQQQRREFLVQLRRVERTLESAESRLASAEMAEEFAQKSYEITVARFDVGAATATDLIDAQISLNLARHERLDSIIDFNLAAKRYIALYFPELTGGD